MGYINKIVLYCNCIVIQNPAVKALTETRKEITFLPYHHWLPAKSRFDMKVLLTYQVLKDQTWSYLKDLIVSYYPNGAILSQTAGLLVVPRVSKRGTGDEVFSYQLNSQFRFRRQVPSLLFRLGFKLQIWRTSCDFVLGTSPLFPSVLVYHHIFIMMINH